MAEPRQHYPAGETGLRQYAYELSVCTDALVLLYAMGQSLANEVARHSTALKELEEANRLAEHYRQKAKANDPSKR